MNALLCRGGLRVRLWLLPLCTALAAGCASGPLQTAVERDAASVAPAPLVPAPVVAAPPEAFPAAVSREITSEVLRNTLAVFQFESQDVRRSVVRGAALPPLHEQRWISVLELVDAYLARPSGKVTAEQLSQAQAILDAELDRDSRVYGDFPPKLADSILEHQARLAVRSLQLHPPEWKRDPRLKFEWPLEPVQVTSLFGRRFHPIERRYRLHAGVDLAAQSGQLVTAAGPGVVRRAGWCGTYGYQVEVTHGGGVVTRYSHLLQPLVEAGDSVDVGDALGLAGSTGASTGPHLHFEVIRRGIALDPLRQLKMIAGVQYRILSARKASGGHAARRKAGAVVISSRK